MDRRCANSGEGPGRDFTEDVVREGIESCLGVYTAVRAAVGHMTGRRVPVTSVGDRPWRLATGGCAVHGQVQNPLLITSMGQMEKVGCSVGRPGGPQTRQVGGYICPDIKSNVQKYRN